MRRASSRWSPSMRSCFRSRWPCQPRSRDSLARPVSGSPVSAVRRSSRSAHLLGGLPKPRRLRSGWRARWRRRITWRARSRSAGRPAPSPSPLLAGSSGARFRGGPRTRSGRHDASRRPHPRSASSVAILPSSGGASSVRPALPGGCQPIPRITDAGLRRRGHPGPSRASPAHPRSTSRISGRSGAFARSTTCVMRWASCVTRARDGSSGGRRSPSTGCVAGTTGCATGLAERLLARQPAVGSIDHRCTGSRSPVES